MQITALYRRQLATNTYPSLPYLLLSDSGLLHGPDRRHSVDQLSIELHRERHEVGVLLDDAR